MKIYFRISLKKVKVTIFNILAFTSTTQVTTIFQVNFYFTSESNASMKLQMERIITIDTEMNDV